MGWVMLERHGWMGGGGGVVSGEAGRGERERLEAGNSRKLDQQGKLLGNGDGEGVVTGQLDGEASLGGVVGEGYLQGEDGGDV